MNGAAALETALDIVVVPVESFSADRHRRNTPAFIPSRLQNPGTVNPLDAWRENNRRHVAALRLTRLLLPIEISGYLQRSSIVRS